jgi:type I restriction enzyme M protein
VVRVTKAAGDLRPIPTGIAALNSAIWSICDVLRRSKCTGAMQYVPELTWILFLRVLDDKEHAQQAEAEAVGAAFAPSLRAPYRWRDWAAPSGAKRKSLEAGALGSFFGFVNGELIPHLKSLAHNPNATARQKIIGEALSGVEKTRVDTEKNLLDVLDRVDALNLHAADGTHMFPLSQVYEGLLLKMGDKGNDGGQFFTPREVIRAIVQTIDPKPGETIYDPGCGTGGFLAEAFEHVRSNFKADATVEESRSSRDAYSVWARKRGPRLSTSSCQLNAAWRRPAAYLARQHADRRRDVRRTVARRAEPIRCRTD